MGFELIFVKFIHHIQEILYVTEIFGWYIVLPADPVPERISSYCGNITN